MKQGSFAPAGLCCPDHQHYYDPLRLPLDHRPLHGAAAYRPMLLPVPRRDRAEEGLPSSQNNCLTVPRPLRREVPPHPLQDSGMRSMAFALFTRARLLLDHPKAANTYSAAGFA
jgi:hypothetical protein